MLSRVKCTYWSKEHLAYLWWSRGLYVYFCSDSCFEKWLLWFEAEHPSCERIREEVDSIPGCDGEKCATNARR